MERREDISTSTKRDGLQLFTAPSNERDISLSLSLFFSNADRERGRGEGIAFSRAGRGFIRSVFAQLVASVTLFFSFFTAPPLPCSWDKPLSRSLIRRRSRDRILSCEASFESSLNSLSPFHLSLSLASSLPASFFFYFFLPFFFYPLEDNSPVHAPARLASLRALEKHDNYRVVRAVHCWKFISL